MQTFFVVHLVLLVFACWCFHWRSDVKKRRQAVQAVAAAYRRGQYEEGMKLAEVLKQGPSKSREYWLFRGKMLYQSGELEEAAQCLGTGLTVETQPRPKALIREALGKVLMEQENYQDAADCFANAVADFPACGGGHRGLAEVWLRQATHSDEALTRARQAVDLDRSAKDLAKDVHNLNLAESTATLAWALAVNSHDAAEVDRLLARAMLLCGEDAKPVAAQVNYHAGMAYAALGNPSQSSYYLQMAAEANPSGIFGRRAKTARVA